MGKYTNQYKELHRRGRYGTSSEKLLQYVKENMPPDAERVLDYGCGQSRLMDMLAPKHPFRYDPSVERYEKKPSGPMDLVICTDVLEHVPEEELDAVLTDIFSYSSRVFMTISLIPAHAHLPNGENAHCTVKPKEWWEDKLKNHTDTIHVIQKLSNNGRLGIKTY